MSLSNVQNFARVLALGYMGTGIASLAFSAPLVTNGDCIAKNVGNGKEEVAPVSTTRKNAPTHPTVFHLANVLVVLDVFGG